MMGGDQVKEQVEVFRRERGQFINQDLGFDWHRFWRFDAGDSELSTEIRVVWPCERGVVGFRAAKQFQDAERAGEFVAKSGAPFQIVLQLTGVASLPRTEAALLLVRARRFGGPVAMPANRFPVLARFGLEFGEECPMGFAPIVEAHGKAQQLGQPNWEAAGQLSVSKDRFQLPGNVAAVLGDGLPRGFAGAVRFLARIWIGGFFLLSVRRLRHLPRSKREALVIGLTSPAGVRPVSAASDFQEEYLAGVNTIRVRSLQARPSVTVVPAPDAASWLLLHELPEADLASDRHRAQLGMFGPPGLGWVFSFQCVAVTPENLNVKFVGITDEAGDIHVGSGQVGRCVEEFKEVIITRDEARLVGEQTTTD